MRFAYADPPYPGMWAKHYSHDPRGEVDHAVLIAQLQGEYPDGWALSTGSVNLHEILPLCPEDVRVAAWVKPLVFYKPGVTVAYAWEPILWRGGRKRPRSLPTLNDFLSANVTFGRGLVGVKPDAFNDYILELLNVQPDDQFDDLFPGSGGMARALERRFRTRQLRLESVADPQAGGDEHPVPRRVDG